MDYFFLPDVKFKTPNTSKKPSKLLSVGFADAGVPVFVFTKEWLFPESWYFTLNISLENLNQQTVSPGEKNPVSVSACATGTSVTDPRANCKLWGS
jgi:hypothetical protein